MNKTKNGWQWSGRFGNSPTRLNFNYMLKNKFWFWVITLLAVFGGATGAFAGEADIVIPPLDKVSFSGLGGISGATLMYLGLAVCLVGAIFGLVQYKQTKALPVHESMAKVSNTIWETCKTYLFTQGKFLAILWVLIAACMVYYFMGAAAQRRSATSLSFCSLPSWASSAPTASPGSASASTPSPTRAPPFPRSKATRWPPSASRCAPA